MPRQTEIASVLGETITSRRAPPTPRGSPRTGPLHDLQDASAGYGFDRIETRVAQAWSSLRAAANWPRPGAASSLVQRMCRARLRPEGDGAGVPESGAERISSG